MPKIPYVFEDVDEQYNVRIDDIRRVAGNYLHLLTGDVYSMMLRPLIRVRVDGFLGSGKRDEHHYGFYERYTENALGQLHSFDDEPAIVSTHGNLHWYMGGLEHRDGDQPSSILANGSLIYYKFGKRHRQGGADGSKPAIILSTGIVRYYQEGKLHRLDGPAVVNPLGDGLYYVHDYQIKGADQVAHLDRYLYTFRWGDLWSDVCGVVYRLGCWWL